MLGALDVKIDDTELNLLIQELMFDFATSPFAPSDFAGYFESPQALAIINNRINSVVNGEELNAQVQALLQAYIMQILQSVFKTLEAQITEAFTGMTSQITEAITGSLSSAMSQLGASLKSAFNFDPNMFADIMNFDIDEEEVRALMMAMLTGTNTTFEGNLRQFDYADLAKPTAISIYPKDFDSKEEVIRILDEYNDRMEAQGFEDRMISYTDLVGALMSSVTTIINTIGYVLIAFVSISLVVSSIMIGIITYISVLERKKEIGILRSIGASKGDIGRVFTAETLIVGLGAGLLGVGSVALATIPINLVGRQLLDIERITILPWEAAAILVAISMFLSFVAGLIPSSAASRKDPVEALRSE